MLDERRKLRIVDYGTFRKLSRTYVTEYYVQYHLGCSIDSNLIHSYESRNRLAAILIHHTPLT